MRKAVTVFLAALGLTACGASGGGSGTGANDVAEERGLDVTQSTMSDLAGKFQEPKGKETFDFNSDGTYRKLLFRQVGTEGSVDVPFGTVCNFIEVGRIRVEKRLEENRSRYLDRATHILTMFPSMVELSDTLHPSTSNVACVKYVERENSWLSNADSPQRSSYLEIIDSDSLQIDITTWSKGVRFDRIR